MPTDVNPQDMVVFGVILVIVCFLVFIVDFVIFCYWLSFKYKEYSYQQAYGPILTFPPRDTAQMFPLGAESSATEPWSEATVSFEDPASPMADDPTSNDQTPPHLTSPTPPPSSLVPRAAREPWGEEPSAPTPNAERRTPTQFAPPAFDFLPAAVCSEELSAHEQREGEELHVHEQPEEPSSEASVEIGGLVEPPTQDSAYGQIGEVEAEYPAVPADPLEDMRPVDPVLLSAIGGIRSPFASTWSLVHPFIGIQVVLAAVTAFSIILLLPKMFTAGQNVMSTPYGLAVLIASLFIQNAGFVGITAYLVKGYGTSLRRIGLRAPTSREVVLGLVCGAGLCLAAMLLEKGFDAGASHFASKQFMNRMGKLTDGLSAGGTFEQIHSVPFQIWFIIGGAIAAPIGEEVFFRGLLYNSIKKRWGVPAGVVLSGICFGLIHVAPLAVIIIIPMGCILAMVYERTKSLWVTILMHAVNNGAQLVFAMYTMNRVAGHK